MEYGFALIPFGAAALSIVMIVRVYRLLPERVPLNFDILGRPQRYDRRPVIFVLSAVEVLLSGGAVAAVVSPPRTGHPHAETLSALIVLAGSSIAVLFLLRGVLRVALGRDQRMRGMAIFFGIIAASAAFGYVASR